VTKFRRGDVVRCVSETEDLWVRVEVCLELTFSGWVLKCRSGHYRPHEYEPMWGTSFFNSVEQQANCEVDAGEEI